MLSVVSDYKVGVDDNSNWEAEYYLSKVKSAQDYYAFGMTQPGRSFVSEDYRYGFNGKEKDEDGELGELTHYDYGFRIYNPGIGRFLSVDPIAPDYPELSPYQFASNTPIQAIDIDGLESWWNADGNLVGVGPMLTVPGSVFSYVPGMFDKFVGKIDLGGTIVRVPKSLEREFIQISEPKGKTPNGKGNKKTFKLFTISSKGASALISALFTPTSFGDGDVPLPLVSEIKRYATDPSELDDDYLRGVRERVINGTATETDYLYADEAFKRAELSDNHLVPNEDDFPIFGENFDKKVRKHIDQVRKRYDNEIERIPSPNKGGAKRIREIIKERIARGGGRPSTFSGEPVTIFEDGKVVYVIKKDGQFWTILRNTNPDADTTNPNKPSEDKED